MPPCAIQMVGGRKQACKVNRSPITRRKINLKPSLYVCDYCELIVTCVQILYHQIRSVNTSMTSSCLLCVHYLGNFDGGTVKPVGVTCPLFIQWLACISYLLEFYQHCHIMHHFSMLVIVPTASKNNWRFLFYFVQ